MVLRAVHAGPCRDFSGTPGPLERSQVSPRKFQRGPIDGSGFPRNLGKGVGPVTSVHPSRVRKAVSGKSVSSLRELRKNSRKLPAILVRVACLKKISYLFSGSGLKTGDFIEFCLCEFCVGVEYDWSGEALWSMRATIEP